MGALGRRHLRLRSEHNDSFARLPTCCLISYQSQPCSSPCTSETNETLLPVHRTTAAAVRLISSSTCKQSQRSSIKLPMFEAVPGAWKGRTYQPGITPPMCIDHIYVQFHPSSVTPPTPPSPLRQEKTHVCAVMFTRLRSLSNRGLPTLHPPEAPATTAAGDDRKSLPVHDESFSFRLDIPTPDSDIYDSFEQAREKKEEEEYLLRSACFDPDPIELLSFDDNTLRGYLDLDTPLCGERGDDWAGLVQSAAVDVHLEAEGEQDGLSAPAVDTAVDTTTAADTDIATETDIAIETDTGVATNMHINDSAVSLSPPSATPTQQQQQLLQQPLQQQEYDNIGTRYKSLEDSPLGAIDFATTRKALGNVKGLKVLDLACGIGRWARWCVEHGDAERVVGIDISKTMVEGANEMKTNLTDERLKERLEFRVGDCSVPLSEEEGGRGFDLVLGSWYRELPVLLSLGT